jgi:DeoR/GlpR family transcriptional regulator of sugar metabolism
MEISSIPGFEVVLLGGEIDKKYQFTFGVDAQNQLDSYHANKCILSVDGISQKDGLSLYYSNETGIVRKMIASSDEVIVAADSSKIGKSAFSRVASLSQMNILLTNRTDKKEELEEIKAMGIEVYTTKK